MTKLATALRPLSRFALAAGLAGVVGLVSPASISFAQSDTVTVTPNARQARALRRGHQAHERRGVMRHLGLSDAQRLQIRTLRSEAREARRSGATPDRAALRAQVRAVLTPAQRTQAAELRQSRRGERIDRRMTRMTERLSLTPAQATEVRGILSGAAAERRALEGDRSTTREARAAIRANTRASVRAVLTPEQTAQLREGRANRGERRQGRHNRRGRSAR
ncbi:MAG: hypothetical protein AB8I08_19600 [Sandaracinaceae bacterium]